MPIKTEKKNSAASVPPSAEELSHATDDHIGRVAGKDIKRLGGFAKGCQYLLANSQNGWRVAYAPPVVSKKGGLPIHAYLAEDEETAAFLAAPFSGHYVLSELKSVLGKDGDKKAKIIFPYLIVEKEDLDDENNHYVTVEIQVVKTEDGYLVTTCAHDPYGKKYTFSYDEQQKLMRAFKDKFGEHKCQFAWPDSPYMGIGRQKAGDSTSCGFICIDECFRRIEDKPLEINDARYGDNAKALREEQSKLVSSAGLDRSNVVEVLSKTLKFEERNGGYANGNVTALFDDASGCLTLSCKGQDPKEIELMVEALAKSYDASGIPRGDSRRTMQIVKFASPEAKAMMEKAAAKYGLTISEPKAEAEARESKIAGAAPAVKSSPTAKSSSPAAKSDVPADDKENRGVDINISPAPRR